LFGDFEDLFDGAAHRFGDSPGGGESEGLLAIGRPEIDVGRGVSFRREVVENLPDEGRFAETAFGMDEDLVPVVDVGRQIGLLLLAIAEEGAFNEAAVLERIHEHR